MVPHRKRILIVDDVPTSLVWQLVLLQEEHYDTLTAITTAEGIRIAKLERPDLIVLDQASRRSDVAAAVRALRADPATSHIPILLLVPGGASPSDASARGEAAGDAHVAKPLLGSEYLMKVRELVGRRAIPRPRHATEPENP
jgi:two-component system, cell cycle response regulator